MRDEEPMTWRHAVRSVEYWALLAVGLAGLAQAPAGITIVASALVLSLASWPGSRWGEVVDKARAIDRDWRELAALAWASGQTRYAMACWVRGHFAVLVFAAHMINNLFHCGLAYGAGLLAAWLWGI